MKARAATWPWRTAIGARDANLTQPTHIVAVHPVAQTGNLDTRSYPDSSTARPLNKAMIGWFVDKLIAKASDKTDPRLGLVNDVSGRRRAGAQTVQ